MNEIEKSFFSIFESLISEYKFTKKNNSYIKLSEDANFLFLIQFEHLKKRRVFKIYFSVFPICAGFLSHEVLDGYDTIELGQDTGHLYRCDWYYGASYLEDTKVIIKNAFDSVISLLIPLFESIKDASTYLSNMGVIKNELGVLEGYARIEVWPHLELKNYDKAMSIIETVCEIETDIDELKRIKVAIQKNDEEYISRKLTDNIICSKKALAELGLIV